MKTINQFTLSPSCAAFMEATYPPGPAPIITTSKISSIMI